MDESSFLPSRTSGRRGTCTPDLSRLLARLALRQALLPTVRMMQDGSGYQPLSQTDIIAGLFSTSGRPRVRAAGGAFNRGTAQYLAGRDDGEEAVYRGA
jgi:hypothetical protein